MECKQCSAANDERAVECGYCGAQLRRPYVGDPLGKWLKELSDDFTERHVRFGFFVAVLGCSLVAAVAAGVAARVLLTWTMWWAIFLGVALSLLLGGLVFCVESRVEVRRRRAAFERDYWPRIQSFGETNGIKGWRLHVVAGETFTKWSLLRGYLLDHREPSERA